MTYDDSFSRYQGLWQYMPNTWTDGPSKEILPDPPRRGKEKDDDYRSRCARWQKWWQQEPDVDLWSTSDTEVAEYRAWAGTTKYHAQRIKELSALLFDGDQK